MSYLESSSLVVFCVNPGSEGQLIYEDLGCFGKQNRSLNQHKNITITSTQNTYQQHSLYY